MHQGSYTSGKREPQLKHCLHQTGLWAIFLTNDEWEEQPTPGVTIPRLVGIGDI